MLLCEIWPGGSKVKHVFPNSTKVDHVQTKLKHGCRKSTMFHYIVYYMLIQPNMQHMNNVTFDVNQRLCRIVMFCHILTFTIFYVWLWHSSTFMSLSEIHVFNLCQRVWKGFVTLQCWASAIFYCKIKLIIMF